MKRFKKVYIEITNVCNLSCNFCPKTSRKLQFMDEESFVKVIKQVKPYTDYIYFHLMGEPFLNPNLKKFLEISYENGLKVNITTNGTLINNVKDILLESKALRQVNISLHSFEANDNNISLEEYIDNVMNFILEAREKSKVITSTRLWNMDSNELRGSNKYNKDIINMIESKLGLEIDLKESLKNVRGIKLWDRVYLNMAEKFEWPDIDRLGTDCEIFCYGLRDQMGVLVDGTVVPCCLDSEGNIELGNIFKEDLEDILNSDRAINLYDGFSRRRAVEDLCKRCGYAKRYKK